MSGPLSGGDVELSHQHVGGSAGGPGENSAKCACGVVFDGFDSQAEVMAVLDQHIAGPLPRLGEVIRDAEHLGAQLLAVLGRAVDPASEPTVLAWPTISDTIRVHDVLMMTASRQVADTLATLARIAALPMPPVGSAIKTPARQDPNPITPGLRIATTDGPDQTTRLDPGEEPTPGSAVDVAAPTRESDRGPRTPGAGASSGPSPRHTHTVPDGTGGRRGAGPGYLMCKVLALTTAAAASLALVASAPPADAAALKPQVPAKAVAWDGRVVEVVNKLPGSWGKAVVAGVDWVDLYTGSDMRFVQACSGSAIRCITIVNERIAPRPDGSRPTGLKTGYTTVIDIWRIENEEPFKGDFDEATKTYLIAHETGHQRWLEGHPADSDCSTVMNRFYRCNGRVPPLAFNAAQQTHLATY